MLFKLFLVYYFITTVAVCQNGFLEFFSSKNIADLTQRVMEIGAERMKNNQQANRTFPRPLLKARERSESKPGPSKEFGGDLLRMFSSLKTPTAEGAYSVGIVPSSSSNKEPRSSESGCNPFVHGFMKIAYENCAKFAEQKTADAWGKEVRSFITGQGINISKASKETCRRMAERSQCDQLRKAISDCDVFNSVQITLNIQRELDKCNELLDEGPTSLIGGVNELINGPIAKNFFNKLLG